MTTHGSTTDDLEIRRYRAAVAELRAAGLFSSFRNDDGPSWWETVFQSGWQIEYLSRRQSVVSFAAIFLPVTVITHFLLYLQNPEPIPGLVIRITLNCLVMPLLFSSVAWRQVQSHGLTPWEDLAS